MCASLHVLGASVQRTQEAHCLLQGLLLYDGEGQITYSRNLDADIAMEGIAIARQYGARPDSCLHAAANIAERCRGHVSRLRGLPLVGRRRPCRSLEMKAGRLFLNGISCVAAVHTPP